MSNKRRFFMQLKEYRKKLGLSQDDIAKKLGVHNTTYGNWELGKTEPTVDTLIKLADFYNVTVDELLGREADTINLKFLGETESYLIKKILKMNQLELDKTKAYVMGLTE